MASKNEIQATSGRSAGVGAPSPKVGAVDMTRRMVCGGLAGMIAKVSWKYHLMRDFSSSIITTIINDTTQSIDSDCTTRTY